MMAAGFKPVQRLSGVSGRVLPTPLFRPSETRRKPGLFWATLAHPGNCDMAEMSPSQQRRTARRRKAAVIRAVEYLNAGLTGLSGVRPGTAEKQVRGSPQPMSTAKALVKDWRRRHRSLATKPTPRDERAQLIHTAYAIELGHAWPAGHGIELTNERGNHV